jgi:hypothetical protein
VRRQVSFELGGPDAEPTKDAKFQILQKYGIAAARIDRGVTKPKWMTEAAWNEKRAQFYKMTTGLVPREQFKRTSRYSRVPQRNRPQDSRNFRPNSSPTKTATRLNSRSNSYGNYGGNTSR